MKIDTTTQQGRYDEAVTYVLHKLQKNRVAVLASCGTDMHVSARSMSIVNFGLDIWFQTDRRFKKKRQIDENPRVALALDNIQIEGTAEVQGHPSSESNTWFCKEFALYHRGSFDAYTNTRHEVVYRVVPETIILWRYENGQSYRDFIDIQKKKAQRKYYTVEQV